MAEDNSIFEKMIEMGMGLTIANQIPRMMSSVMPNQQGGQTPPPLNQAEGQLYASINGNQAGPFTEQEFIVLIQKKIVTRETLVWKNGLPNWVAAAQVPEVGKLLLLYSNEK